MYANPSLGAKVRIHYGKRYALLCQHLQDRVGDIVVVGKGKPRNHGVMVDGEVYVIPCGNLNKIQGGI